MKGIILAGGSGTRLWPLTAATNKSLLPVFDKPMIYYPLTNLMLYGIREVLIITNETQVPLFENLLGNGNQWGIEISYAIQDKPSGIAQAISIGQDFIGSENFALILGDNLIYGPGIGRNLISQLSFPGATMTIYEVANPSEYGVAYLNQKDEVTQIIEKPLDGKSNWAIPGLYFLDCDSIELVKDLKPSPRGELEITELLRTYLHSSKLKTIKLPRGTAWLDLGNPRSLLDASEFIKSLQTRQGLLIGSPEETAWRMGYVRSSTVSVPVNIQNDYSEMLKDLRDE
jgi:glucose-1-phosphate thymidylyltransferase